MSSALDILTYTPKKAAALISKTLKTAIADAEHNFSLDTNTLVVKEATIGIGPAIKRFKPRAKGSAGAIRKPTSHIFITLTGSAPEKKQRAPRKAATKKVEKTEEGAAEEQA